ncbi:DUF481 domain-containing protein [Flavobacteriaceae bacterium F89]|uniref:DUF481 domain-containing protein n=1 Tax=Cerina litoralis TaxID=2874477 RepID=A0AAE3JNZ1_9FLAO|nr:DUF481 domain-containing protein [Cerina litoralis]MCG2460244.1 DUF481 domain-containing protein [Cerina litoralis]
MAQKTDSLTLKNGDKIIGEIKEMTKGVLTIETDYSDSDFTITWKDIVSINSKHNYLITLSNGTRINSSIVTKPRDSAQVVLNENGKEVLVKIKNIVYVKAVKASFFSRLDASLSLGFNFTKSNALKQLTVRSDFTYTGEKWGFTGGYNSVLSSQDSVADTKRIDANIGAKYFLKHDWYALLSADFLSNDEQKLKLRSTTRAGMGKYLVHSNRTYLTTGGGLAWNNEQYTTPDQSDKNSLEVFVGIGYNMFDFDDISLNTNLVAYPSLTEGGRLRSDFSFDIKYDLPLDFFIMAGFTYNYDNRPVEGASRVDYVIQTTFGWKL